MRVVGGRGNYLKEVFIATGICSFKLQFDQNGPLHFPLGGIFEPSHEIMVLFILRKLILQTRMGSHPVGLDV